MNKVSCSPDGWRWEIVEQYYGVYDCEFAVARVECISMAQIIIDQLVKYYHGRPFTFYARKIVDDYVEGCDEIIHDNPISGEHFDFSIYLKGVSCL